MTGIMNYNVNEKGYYGEFGGAFIPEMLYPNVEELRQNYLKIMAEPDFKKEFDKLLKDYPSTKPYFLSGGIGLNAVERIKVFEKSPSS
jgi:tryptophan synthase beta subunit